MDELNEIREKARELYKEIEEVHCPFLKEKVVFTSVGFNHIQYKNHKGKQRHKNVQQIRYKILKLAHKVLRDSKTLQEYEEQSLFVEVKQNKRKERILKPVRFFGFIAIIDERKVKVIVRQVGNGKKHFWSIIPNWRTRKSKEGNKFLNYTGNMAKD